MQARQVLTFAYTLTSLLPLSALATATDQPAATSLFAMRTQNSANGLNLATGDVLFWGANSVTPADTTWGVTRQCPVGSSCTTPDDPDWIRQGLYWRPYTWLPNQYFASRPYDASLSGAWRLSLSSDPDFPNDPTKSLFVNTPAVGDVPLMPFVASMSVQGAGLTPTIRWQLPTALPAGLGIDQVRIAIFDNSHPVEVISRSPAFYNPFRQGDLIFVSDPLDISTTSFSLPASWSLPDGGSKSLTFGTQYSIAIRLEDTRADGSVRSRSQSFFDFTPIDLPGLEVHLPTTVPVPTTSGLTSGSLYAFNVDSVSPDEVTFIDPFVATGYTYIKGDTDPNFKSVQIATHVGDGLYEVWTWGGTDWQMAASDLGVNTAYDFGPGGVDRFQIRGIETSAGLSPFDVTAFVTGLTFTETGNFTGTMQAIVTEVAAVPEPAEWAFMLAGLGLLGLATRGRRP